MQPTDGPWIELYEVRSQCKGMGSYRPRGGGFAEKCQDCDADHMSPRKITLPDLKKMLREAK